MSVSWIISGNGCSSVCTFTNSVKWSKPSPRLGAPWMASGIWCFSAASNIGEKKSSP